MSETVVVGYDGSDGAGRALDRAIEEVKASGGTLIIAAVEYMPVDPGLAGVDNIDLTLHREPLPLPVLEPTPELEALIARAKGRADDAGVTSDHVWGYGDPARTIVDAARQNAATKIFVGADHHGFLGRLFGGDVEAAVRREADCEVVVVE